MDAELRRQEIAFSIVMGILAVLSRGNPLVSFPEILWAFEALLAFNFAYHFLLKRGLAASSAPFASTAVNILIVTLVLRWSGGADSYFWPMYLLPIFTACLCLESVHVVVAVAASIVFLGLFYLEAFWWREPSAVLELVIKAGVLALAAAVTGRVSHRERRGRLALEKSRAELERLARWMTRESPARDATSTMRLRHDINNRLAVVLGTVDVLMAESPADSGLCEDLQRMARAGRECRDLITMLAAAAQTGQAPPRTCDTVSFKS